MVGTGGSVHDDLEDVQGPLGYSHHRARPPNSN